MYILFSIQVKHTPRLPRRLVLISEGQTHHNHAALEMWMLKMLLNSFQVHSTSDNTTFFCSNPAQTRDSRSPTLVGTLIAYLLERQKAFTVQLVSFLYLFFSVRGKIWFCLSSTTSLEMCQPNLCWIDLNASTALLHDCPNTLLRPLLEIEP